MTMLVGTVAVGLCRGCVRWPKAPMLRLQSVSVSTRVPLIALPKLCPSLGFFGSQVSSHSLFGVIRERVRRRTLLGIALCFTSTTRFHSSNQVNPKHKPSLTSPTKVNQSIKNLKFTPPKPPTEVEDDSKTTSLHESQLSNRIYTLPNLLCALRMGITPVIGHLIVAHNFEYALALCAISSFTDFLDGWIARTFNAESKLGAVLDPLADKLLVATLTFALTYVGLIPLFLAGLILTRDLMIIAGGLYMQYRYVTPPRTFARFFRMDSFKSDRFRPTVISKVNTGLQLSLVLVSLTSPLCASFFTANYWFLPTLQVSTGVTTLWSGLYYLSRLKT